MVVGDSGQQSRPERARGIPARGAAGYVDRIGVEPGATVRFHVSSPSAYQLKVVRLGRGAIADPATGTAADRAESETMASFDRALANPHSIEPGSYIHVGGEPLPGGPLTCGLWLRLWRLPVLDELQYAWSGLITDLDYPSASRFAMWVDHLGRVGVYLGDGRAFDHEHLYLSRRLLAERLGEWTHVSASIGAGGLSVYLDGIVAMHRAVPVHGIAAPMSGSRMRIGASAERGLTDDLLDGDIAAPFVASGTLSEAQLRSVVADRGRRPLGQLGLGQLQGAWDLDEEAGAIVADSSGHGRHGTVAQGGTWQIGGPAFDASRGTPGYDPATDPDRGHGLRLSSDDLLDAEWPVTEEWLVPREAPSGLYAGIVRLAGQSEQDALAITFAVVRKMPRRPDSVALLLSTNTWYAYGRRPAAVAPSFGLSASFYSTHHSGRPHFWLTTQAPIPRATPFGFESERAASTGHSHLVRPERYAEAWLEREGFAYEVITDHDLHEHPKLLGGYAALFVTGHSEYWSDAARDGVEAYLDHGGDVLSLSGDSCHWRVTLDPTASVLECRKEAADNDPRWLSPDEWGERWHAHDGCPGGGYRLLGRNTHETFGLDPQGMIDDGTPTGFRPLQVQEPQHRLFWEPERVPVTPQGTIGEASLNGPKISGYEFDAVRESVGTAEAPLSGLTLLATSRQPNLEWQGTDANRGADLVYWERPAGGRVVSLGSVGATGSLSVDTGISTLVANVLHMFGVARLK